MRGCGQFVGHEGLRGRQDWSTGVPEWWSNGKRSMQETPAFVKTTAGRPRLRRGFGEPGNTGDRRRTPRHSGCHPEPVPKAGGHGRSRWGVTPAKAGVQKSFPLLDSGFRRNDRKAPFRCFLASSKVIKFRAFVVVFLFFFLLSSCLKSGQSTGRTAKPGDQWRCLKAGETNLFVCPAEGWRHVDFKHFSVFSVPRW